MKISIAISFLILAAAAGLSWRHQQQLTVLRVSATKLAAEAAVFGISTRTSEDAESRRTTQRVREDKDPAAKRIAGKFLAFAQDYAADAIDSPPKEEKNKRRRGLMNLMSTMDAGQLKSLISELHAAKGIGGSEREMLFFDAARMLGSQHPQTALEFYSKLPGFLDGEFPQNRDGQNLVTSTVASWAKLDPTAALAWVKQSSGKFPDTWTDNIKLGMVYGTALSDPKSSFKLISELGITNTQGAIYGIVNRAKTPEQQTSVLTALRDHLTSLPDEGKRDSARNMGFAVLARGLTEDGFEAASKWLATANLTPEETEKFASSLDIRNQQHSQWIDWIGRTLPGGKGAASISAIVNRWTENDYQAAGKWLTTTPAGPSKDTAIRSYAETVARFEPETAAQWALTLPPGQNRSDTLANIYRNWPIKDPTTKAAAERFKLTHRIP